MKRAVITFFVGMLYFFQVSSAPISPSTQIEIEREQQQRLLDLEAAKSELENITPTKTMPIEIPVEEGACFELITITITFTGNTVFSDEELMSLIEFSPKCIGLSHINNYLKVITNKYVSEGYVTSRAFLTPQDLSKGTLEIVIVEGKLEAFLLNGSQAPSLEMALPNLINGLLNLRDIEQGLDQINRLSRYNAKIKMLPGSKPGYSIVNIETHEGSFGSASIGFNNGGQKSTGETQLNMSLSADNVLGLLDNWSLSGSKSSEFATEFDAESLSLGVSIPYGYWTTSFRTSYSSYLTTFENNSMTFDSTGRTNTHDLSTKWLFHRDDISKSSLKLGVNHRREKNYILGSLLTGSSRNLSSFSIGLEHSTRLLGGFLTVSPQYVRGAKLFNSETDENKRSGLPSSEFDKGTVTLNYSHSLTDRIAVNTSLFGQWTTDNLYGSQRMSIGGEYSVRGFKETSISGDEGYYWRNDATMQLAQHPLFGRVSAQFAIDTGAISPDKFDDYERGHLTGTSLTLRTANQHWSSSFSAGFPIDAPSRLNVNDYSLYYRIDLKI